MHEMRPQSIDPKPEPSDATPQSVPQPLRPNHRPRVLPAPLAFADLEARVLLQRTQRQLTNEQREALRILVDIDEDYRQRPLMERFGFEISACYSVVQQLNRPSFRCDSDESIASFPDKLPLQALGWTLPKPTIEAALKAVVGSVGRIEPSNGSHKKYAGTGFLVSETQDGHGVVMTNWHVVRAMQNGSMDWTQHEGRIYFTTQFYVDFDGSERRDLRLRSRVLNARAHPDPYAIGFRRLDIALLDVDLTPTRMAHKAESPRSISPVRIHESTVYSRSPKHPLLVVGFPLRANQFGVHKGVDWTKLVAAIFGEDFGFKRVSPGLLTQPVGSYDQTEDPCQWIVGHDASTLKGSSGSPVFSADGSGVFAIHFCGADLQVNHAHSLYDADSTIRRMGT